MCQPSWPLSLRQLHTWHTECNTKSVSRAWPGRVFQGQEPRVARPHTKEVSKPMKTVQALASVAVVVCLVSFAFGWPQRKAPGGKAPQAPVKAAAPAQEPDPNAPRPDDVSAFMRVKLNLAQKVLEGIATEDFDEVAKNAQQMGLMAQDENWKVYQTPEYRTHSGEFQRIAANLTKAGQDKNVDSAALAYIQLTMTCVNCHKHTRTIRLASAQ